MSEKQSWDICIKCRYIVVLFTIIWDGHCQPTFCGITNDCFLDETCISIEVSRRRNKYIFILPRKLKLMERESDHILESSEICISWTIRTKINKHSIFLGVGDLHLCAQRVGEEEDKLCWGLQCPEEAGVGDYVKYSLLHLLETLITLLFTVFSLTAIFLLTSILIRVSHRLGHSFSNNSCSFP